MCPSTPSITACNIVDTPQAQILLALHRGPHPGNQVGSSTIATFVEDQRGSMRDWWLASAGCSASGRCDPFTRARHNDYRSALLALPVELWCETTAAFIQAGDEGDNTASTAGVTAERKASD